MILKKCRGSPGKIASHELDTRLDCLCVAARWYVVLLIVVVLFGLSMLS